MNLQCWKCGASIGEFRSPYSRYEECSACQADLHVCLMCKSYDAGVADACREDQAEFVPDKEKANFCDYFNPRAGAYVSKENADSRAARAKLAELFGDTSDRPEQQQKSEADQALQELKRLFDED